MAKPRTATTPAVRKRQRTAEVQSTNCPDPDVENGGVADDAGVTVEREEIAARAARLGVTPERVLREYARIAFADLRRLLEWGPKGLFVKASEGVSEADAAAISEIVAAAGGGGYRVKFYDKKAALDAIARHLGMFVPLSRHRDEDTPPDPAEDARDVLARRLARLAAGGIEN